MFCQYPCKKLANYAVKIEYEEWTKIFPIPCAVLMIAIIISTYLQTNYYNKWAVKVIYIVYIYIFVLVIWVFAFHTHEDKWVSVTFLSFVFLKYIEYIFLRLPPHSPLSKQAAVDSRERKESGASNFAISTIRSLPVRLFLFRLLPNPTYHDTCTSSPISLTDKMLFLNSLCIRSNKYQRSYCFENLNARIHT